MSRKDLVDIRFQPNASMLIKEDDPEDEDILASEPAIIKETNNAEIVIDVTKQQTQKQRLKGKRFAEIQILMKLKEE